MNTKRSYLDTLNAGRQRRPSATIEQITQSLQNLESKLDRSRDGADDYRYHRDSPAERPANDYGAHGASLSDLGFGSRNRDSGFARPQPFPPVSDTYRSLARDIDRTRVQEDSLESVSRIAVELKSLREELRQQMGSSLHREFETLRQDIDRAYRSAPPGAVGPELTAEIARLSRAVREISERGDDRSVSLLREEFEEVKRALNRLSREDVLANSDRRWAELDRRWSDMEKRFDMRAQTPDPEIAALASRLQTIGEAVNSLPASLSLNSLEDKLRTLASAVDHFARQQEHRPAPETFAAIEERLDEISRAIVASTAAAQAPNFDPEPLQRIEARIGALARQIEEVAEAKPSAEVINHIHQLSSRVDQLAQQRSAPDIALQRLGHQINAIAEKIDHTAATPDPELLERLNQLSQRVDNLAAQSAAPEKALERLGRQISVIAEKIDHAPGVPDPEILDRLGQLSQRVDELATHGSAPAQAVERLAKQIAVIGEKFERSSALPDPAQLFEGIEARFDHLSSMIERRQGDAIEHGNMMFRDLERRLEQVAERIDQRGSDALDNRRVMAAIDSRFAELADQISSSKMGEPSSKAINSLEARLDSISRRLDSSASQVGGIDPDLIRSLESQVSVLSDHLARPSAALPEFEDIAPRLEVLERSIAGSREAVLEAARQAAENAVRSFNGSQTHTAAVTGLAQDLRALESLARRSDERNAKTFDAIHGTLMKIVDRLGSLEGSEGDKAFAPLKMDALNTPSLDPERGAARSDADFRGLARGRTPAEAAAEAAVAAIGSPVAAHPEGAARGKSSLFGGLRSALSARREELATSTTASEPTLDTPRIDLDKPLDAKAANRPLEPGSGGPDLSAIMRRVRDERGQPASASDPDAAKSDFIAAARRAAQAAAAEAEILKRQSDVAGPAKPFRFGEMMRARRKPVLMAAAAVMLALAGLQAAKMYFGRSQDAAANAPMVAEHTTADAAEQAATAATMSAAPKKAMAEDSESTAAEAMPSDSIDPGKPEAATAAASSSPAAAPAAEGAMAAADQAAAAAAASTQTDAAAPADKNAAAAAKTAIGDIPVEAGPVALREAAQAGDAKALFEVGSRYADGRGVTADPKQAAKWYEKAAELGLAPAQYRIGNFFEKGIGVGRDIAKAKTWYQLAADQGNASAMHNLAVLYAMGADGTADNESAARWFTRAAELGVKDSQFNLGILSAKGVGVKQSLEDSYKWFALVANGGDRDAAAKRDEIAKSLRPEQLQRARAAVDMWKPQPLDHEANEVDVPDAWQESSGTTAGIDMKKAIGNIQKILNKNGYDAGNPDGMMGDKTKKAILAFQKDNDLEQTGEINEKLVRALIAKK